MRIADFSRSLALVAVGAGACALGYLMHGETVVGEAVIARDQIHSLEARLDAIQTAHLPRAAPRNAKPRRVARWSRLQTGEFRSRTCWVF
jgi:hypothetical protein